MTLLFYGQDFGKILHVWLNNDAFAINIFIPFISGFLILRKLRISHFKIAPEFKVIFLIILVNIFWAIGFIFELNLIKHISIMSLFPLLMWMFFGTSFAKKLCFPLLFFILSAPIGYEFNGILQNITHFFSWQFLRLLPGDEYVNGLEIINIAGTFIIEPACAGFQFLWPMIAMSLILANYFCQNKKQVLIIILSAIFLPIIANIFRVVILLEIARYFGGKFMLSTDHLTFGWIFFSFVLVLYLLVIWPHIKDFNFWPKKIKHEKTIELESFLIKYMSLPLIFLLSNMFFLKVAIFIKPLI